MVLNLGWSQAKRLRYTELLRSNHGIEVTVQLLDLSHKYLADISHLMLSGQVDIDSSAMESTRTCTMELLDPKKQLALDGNSPSDGSIYFTRQIKVVYTVISLKDRERFDVPIFCGPLSKVDRNGPIISITCSGKEKLASGSVWTTRTFKKGASRGATLKFLLTTLGGEHSSKVLIRDYASVSPSTRKLPADLAISAEKESTPWAVAKRVASGMNRMLYYDGRGNAVVKKVPGGVQYVFREDGVLLSQPTASFDAESVVNSVLVLGAVVGTGKSKRRIVYRAVPSRGHVLSPWSLGRWGRPRYLTEVISDDTIKTTREARSVAKSLLRNKLREQVEVSFECLPVPHLEERDPCSIISSQYTGRFALRKMSIPLTANGRSTVGFNRLVSPRRLRIGNLTRRRIART